MKDYEMKTPYTKHPTARAMEELKKNNGRAVRFQRGGNIVRCFKIVQIALATHGRMGEQNKRPDIMLPTPFFSHSKHNWFTAMTPWRNCSPFINQIGFIGNAVFNQSIDRPFENDIRCLVGTIYCHDSMNVCCRWKRVHVFNKHTHPAPWYVNMFRMGETKKKWLTSKYIYLGQVIAVSIPRELDLSERKSWHHHHTWNTTGRVKKAPGECVCARCSIVDNVILWKPEGYRVTSH